MHGQARVALTAEPPEPRMVSFNRDQSKNTVCVRLFTIKPDRLTRAISPYIALEDETVFTLSD